MPFTPELLDELLKDSKTPEEFFAADGLLEQLTKALVERALQALDDSSPRYGKKQTT